MPEITVTGIISAVDESYMDGGSPTFNYGASAPLRVGMGGSVPTKYRPIIKFQVPKFDGEIKSQKLLLNFTSHVGAAGTRALLLYLVDSPQDDLWVEGTANGAVDPVGVTWNRYVLGLNWATAGGDFDDTPIAIFTFPTTLTGNFEIDIPIDNFKFASGKTYSFILRYADETTTNLYSTITTVSTGRIDAQIEIIRDEEFVAPTASAEGINSSQIEISWEKPAIENYEFTKYEIWHSDTGVFGGEEALLTTITDFDTLSFTHTALVTQSNVNDLFPDLDTYLNGRTKYYRIKVYTTLFSIKTTSTFNATTVPAMRAIYFTFAPMSKNKDEEYIVDNQTLQPYGINVIPHWFFPDDTTPDDQIDYAKLYVYYKPTGVGWGGAASVIETLTIANFDEGVIIEGDVGYRPYKIRGLVYDKGGLGRTARVDFFVDAFDDIEEVVGSAPLDWDYANNAVIDNAQKYSSPNSLKFNSVTGGGSLPEVHKNLSPKYGTLSGTCWIRKSSGGTAGSIFRIELWGNTGAGINKAVHIAVNTNHQLYYETGYAFTSTGLYISLNAWYEVSWWADIATQKWSAKIVIGGISYTICDTVNFAWNAPALAYFDELRIRHDWYSGTSQVWHVDDVVLSDYQFDTFWPASCPVAIPRGKFLSGTPPDMLYLPSDGGSIKVDLEHCAQQSGESLFAEDFIGVPLDKWAKTLWAPGAPPTPTSTLQYLTSPNRLQHAVNSQPIGGVHSAIGLQMKDSAAAAYYWPTSPITKYTGSFHFRSTLRCTNSGGSYLPSDYAAIGLCGYNYYRYPYITSGGGISQTGYKIMLFTDRFSIIRGYPLWTHDANAETLLNVDLGADNPLSLAGTYASYLYVEVFISPIYDKTGALIGDRLFIIYNKSAVSPTAAETYDLETHSYVWVVDSITRDAADQINYTGTLSYSYANPSIALRSMTLDIYRSEINGKLPQPFLTPKGYAIRNKTKNESFPFQPNTPARYPLYCEPDQVSQTVYIEGRIINEHGAQSPSHVWSGKKNSDEFQGGVVNNVDPTAIISIPSVGFTDSSVTMDGSQSIDPEGGDLIYIWDFDDGSAIVETSQPSIGHSYAAADDYTVKLKVRDEAGNESAEVQKTIRIYVALDLFEEVSLMSPFESIALSSPTGGGKTALPEVDYDLIQTMEGGSRVFTLRGIHSDPNGDLTEAERMTNSEFERDFFHMLKNKGQLITLDLDFHGKVKGTITEHTPSMAFDDQMAFQFNMTFQEVDVRQFGE